MSLQLPFRRRNVLAVVLLLAALSSSRAQVDMLMQIPGVTGESTTQNYTGWSDLQSVSFSAVRSTGAPAAQTSGIQVTRFADSISPLLFSRVVQGTSMGAPGTPVNIHYLKMVNNVWKPFIKIELEGARIESISHSTSGETPSESLSLNVTKMTMTTLVYLPNGSEDVSKRQTVVYTFAP